MSLQCMHALPPNQQQLREVLQKQRALTDSLEKDGRDKPTAEEVAEVYRGVQKSVGAYPLLTCLHGCGPKLAKGDQRTPLSLA